jgi:hypothetical protein
VEEVFYFSELVTEIVAVSEIDTAGSFYMWERCLPRLTPPLPIYMEWKRTPNC